MPKKSGENTLEFLHGMPFEVVGVTEGDSP